MIGRQRGRYNTLPRPASQLREMGQVTDYVGLVVKTPGR